MSSYKISYELLNAQGDTLKNIATSIRLSAENIQAINTKLGVSTSFDGVRNNLKTLTAQLEDTSSIINDAGAVLNVIHDMYKSSETAESNRTENVKAYKRDFYKNPIVIVVQEGGGGTSATPASSSGYAAPTNTSYSPSAGTESYTNTSSTPLADQPQVTNIYVNADSGADTGISAGAAAGIGVAGAAAGAAGLAGSKIIKEKLDKKRKVKKDEETKEKTQKPVVQFLEPEQALEIARKKLENLEKWGECNYENYKKDYNY